MKEGIQCLLTRIFGRDVHVISKKNWKIIVYVGYVTVKNKQGEVIAFERYRNGMWREDISGIFNYSAV